MRFFLLASLLASGAFAQSTKSDKPAPTTTGDVAVPYWSDGKTVKFTGYQKWADKPLSWVCFVWDDKDDGSKVASKKEDMKKSDTRYFEAKCKNGKANVQVFAHDGTFPVDSQAVYPKACAGTLQTRTVAKNVEIDCGNFGEKGNKQPEEGSPADEMATSSPLQIGPGSGGDPHFKKWNGKSFDFHGECDLVLVHSDTFADGQGLDVHLRTTIQESFSYIERAAVRVGERTFEIAPHEVIIDGVGHPDDSTLTDFAGYAVAPFVGRTGHQQGYEIQLGRGTIRLQNYQNFLSVRMIGTFDGLGQVSGLMGDAEGYQYGRDGEIRIPDVEKFSMEWQVRHDLDPVLFKEIRAPQWPLRCNMPAVSSARKLQSSDPELVQRARDACAHVAAREDFDNCVQDVLVTGDEGIAGGAW